MLCLNSRIAAATAQNKETSIEIEPNKMLCFCVIARQNLREKTRNREMFARVVDGFDSDATIAMT